MSATPKYAVREHERRFLLAGPPPGLGAGRLIEDTYLTGSRLRLRRVTEADGTVVRKLGHKVPTGDDRGLWHTSLYLDDADGAALAGLTGASLRKRRHLVGELPVAVDVFEGALAGLVTAEVDLHDGGDLPDLSARLEELGLEVVREVTDDPAYAGGALATRAPAPVERAAPAAGVVVRPWRAEDEVGFEPIFRAVLAEGRTYAAAADTDLADFWTGQHVVVAVDEATGEVLGSAKMGPNRPAQGAHVGTASFMVGDRARGRGVGRALGEYVVDWHRREGFRGIQFNAVVATNTAAVTLWRALGFAVVGTVPEAFRLPDGTYADLLVMHLTC